MNDENLDGKMDEINIREGRLCCPPEMLPFLLSKNLSPDDVMEARTWELTFQLKQLNYFALYRLYDEVSAFGSMGLEFENEEGVRWVPKEGTCKLIHHFSSPGRHYTARVKGTKYAFYKFRQSLDRFRDYVTYILVPRPESGAARGK